MPLPDILLRISEKTKTATLPLEFSSAPLNAKNAATYGERVQSKSGEGNPW